MCESVCLLVYVALWVRLPPQHWLINPILRHHLHRVDVCQHHSGDRGDGTPCVLSGTCCSAVSCRPKKDTTEFKGVVFDDIPS